MNESRLPCARRAYKVDSHTWHNRVINSADRLITRSSMKIFILDSDGVLASCLSVPELVFRVQRFIHRAFRQITYQY